MGVEDNVLAKIPMGVEDNVLAKILQEEEDLWAAHQLASTDKRHWNPASTNNTSGLLTGPEYSSDDSGDGPAVDDADLDERSRRAASNDMGVSFEQVAIDQAEADVAKEKMNSLDTTKATTLKTSLWDLLPLDLEREILELARGLEILESAEEATVLVKVIADDCQATLDVAMSALNNVAKALDSLTKADIRELKAFRKPAPAVQITMEGVCIMLDEKPDWPTAKKVLGFSPLLNNLKTYDSSLTRSRT